MKYHGKFESPRKRRRMTMVAALALALVLTVSAGGTLAWLFTSTDPVENTFSPAKIYVEVKEDFNGTAKSNIRVYNGVDSTASEADVYVRLAVIMNCVAGDAICAEHSSNISITLPDAVNGWILGDDGYYYYSTVLKKGETTSRLFNNIFDLYQNGDCCKVQVSFLAQAIQVEPASAVTNAWGVTVNADGTIQVNNN